MKRKLPKLLLLLVGTLSLSGCSLFDDILSGLDGGEGTPTNPSGQGGTPAHEHEWGEPQAVEGSSATCQVAGKVRYTCTICGTSEIRTARLNHVAANPNAYEFDETYHYQHCKWCNETINKVEHIKKEEIVTQYDCTKDGVVRTYCETCSYQAIENHPAEHYYHEHSHEEATCEHAGLITYDPCPGCGGTKADEVLPVAEHEYIAETCKWCQRDVLLDFIDDFDAHGGDASDPIIINSEQEIISLMHYVHLKRVKKIFKCVYEIDNFTTFKAYLGGLMSKATDASILRYYGFGAESDTT